MCHHPRKALRFPLPNHDSFQTALARTGARETKSAIGRHLPQEARPRCSKKYVSSPKLFSVSLCYMERNKAPSLPWKGLLRTSGQRHASNQPLA